LSTCKRISANAQRSPGAKCTAAAAASAAVVAAAAAAAAATAAATARGQRRRRSLPSAAELALLHELVLLQLVLLEQHLLVLVLQKLRVQAAALREDAGRCGRLQLRL
jgi:hypothetical protein